MIEPPTIPMAATCSGHGVLDHFGGEDVRLRRRFVRSTIAGVDPLQECLAVMKIEQAKTTWTQTW
jgi:hypothetical protein